MRVGEAGAAQRPRTTYTEVRDLRSISASAGHRSRTAGDRSISRWVADAPIGHPAVRSDAPQLGDALDVDEVRERREAELHDEQKLGAARVEDSLVAVILEKRLASSTVVGSCS